MSSTGATADLREKPTFLPVVDVAVVGCGPVGLALALQLGRLGHRVAVIERHRAPYPLPRAVHFDDEIARLLQSWGIRPDTSPLIEPFDSVYTFRNGDGETLLQADWRGVGPSGWHVANFFSQPQIEAALAEMVDVLPNVSTRRGVEVTGLSDDGAAVTVTGRLVFADGLTEDVGLLRATYVVGCDGANSTVAQLAGLAPDDLGFHYDWLCVDVVPPADMVFDPVGWQLCDPARPTTLAPAGPGRRRWEFMLLPGESAADLATEEKVWSLLSPWALTADNTILERFTMWRFEARCATRWRAGNILIAGDAAHLMPPFAGQGLCAGIRDAANLTWKLDLVLRGLSSDALLDSYQSERVPHVRAFIDVSRRFGEIVCVTDPEAAAQRDTMMLAAMQQTEAAAMPPPPILGYGGSQPPAPGAGTLSIQGRIGGDDGRVALFDDVVGHGWTLVSCKPQPALAGRALDVARRLDIKQVVLGEPNTAAAFVDADGTYKQWFARLGADIALVRPDFYLIGAVADTARAGELISTLDGLLNLKQ